MTSQNASSFGCGAEVSCGLTDGAEDFAIETKEAGLDHSCLLYISVLIMCDALQLLSSNTAKNWMFSCGFFHNFTLVPCFPQNQCLYNHLVCLCVLPVTF